MRGPVRRRFARARINEPRDVWSHLGMGQIRITREAVVGVQRALAADGEPLTPPEQMGLIRQRTRNTSMVHADNFVRWMRGEFDRGARNKG